MILGFVSFFLSFSLSVFLFILSVFSFSLSVFLSFFFSLSLSLSFLFTSWFHGPSLPQAWLHSTVVTHAAIVALQTHFLDQLPPYFAHQCQPQTLCFDAPFPPPACRRTVSSPYSIWICAGCFVSQPVHIIRQLLQAHEHRSTGSQFTLSSLIGHKLLTASSMTKFFVHYYALPLLVLNRPFPWWDLQYAHDTVLVLMSHSSLAATCLHHCAPLR